jgi:hypothetical protein
MTKQLNQLMAACACETYARVAAEKTVAAADRIVADAVANAATHRRQKLERELLAVLTTHDMAEARTR